MKKINFSDERWSRIKNDSMDWWQNKLDRPLIFATTPTSSSEEPELKRNISQALFADTNISAEQFAKRAVYELSHTNFHADSYPFLNMAFSGPGVLGAYMGGKLTCNDGRIWFHPMDDIPSIEKLNLKFDEDNFWFRRTVDIIKKVKEYSDGNVVIGFPDFGGILDVLSTFFPSESLFYEMADNEDEVIRLIGQIEKAWFAAYDCLFEEFSDLKGYSSWSSTYCDTKTYIHQCDFAYMIGGGHFDKFVLPTLKNEFNFVDNSIYHLDGKGQIIHLDKLIACEKLHCIQWVPGDGNGPPSDYPELISKILDSGKAYHTWANKPQLLDIKKNNGLKGVYVNYTVSENEDIENSLKLFGL